MISGGIAALWRTQRDPWCNSRLAGIFLACNEANMIFNRHTLVRTVWFLCFYKIKHLFQVFARSPQSIPAVGLQYRWWKPLYTSSQWWDAYSVPMTWTTHLLFWCSTVVRHVNMNGREIRSLIFQGMGVLTAAPRAAGGGSRLPALELPGGAAASSSLASEWAAHFSKYLALLGRLGKNNFCNLSPFVADFYLIWRPSTAGTIELQGEMVRMQPVQGAPIT